MPIYEYQCKQCHHRFELIQKITDAMTTHCEQCGQDAAA
ncbi:MAG: transcriptional regulator, partial [Legionella sp. 21-45-4]